MDFNVKSSNFQGFLLVSYARFRKISYLCPRIKSWSNTELRKKCKIQEYGGYIGTDEEGTTGGGDTTQGGGSDTSQGGSGTTGGGTQEGGGGGSQDSGDGLE